MKIKLLRDVITSEKGRLVRDQVTDVSDGLAWELVSKAAAIAYEPLERVFVEDEIVAAPEHIGGGWYELPDGTRVQGKEAAWEALEE